MRGTARTGAAEVFTGPAGSGQPPRVPLPRSSVEDTGLPLLEPAPLVLEHRVLKSLLGAWALAACSAQETAAVEEHLGECGSCADEALRLRGAVGAAASPGEPRSRPVAAHPGPGGLPGPASGAYPGAEWAAPYDVEAGRLTRCCRT